MIDFEHCSWQIHKQHFAKWLLKKVKALQLLHVGRGVRPITGLHKQKTLFIKVELPKGTDYPKEAILSLWLFFLLFHIVQLLDLYVFYTSNFRENVATKWKKWEVKRHVYSWIWFWKTCERTRVLHLSDEDTTWCKAWKFVLANLQEGQHARFYCKVNHFCIKFSWVWDLCYCTVLSSWGTHLPENAAVDKV